MSRSRVEGSIAGACVGVVNPPSPKRDMVTKCSAREFLAEYCVRMAMLIGARYSSTLSQTEGSVEGFPAHGQEGLTGAGVSAVSAAATPLNRRSER